MRKAKIFLGSAAVGWTLVFGIFGVFASIEPRAILEDIWALIGLVATLTFVGAMDYVVLVIVTLGQPVLLRDSVLLRKRGLFPFLHLRKVPLESVREIRLIVGKEHVTARFRLAGGEVAACRFYDPGHRVVRIIETLSRDLGIEVNSGAERSPE